MRLKVKRQELGYGVYKKKKAVIMLEVLVLLNLLLVLIVYNSKAIAASSSKFSYYGIKEDILTIDEVQNDFLNEAAEYINDNEEILNIFILYKEDKTISYKYVCTKDNKMRLEIINGIILIKGKYNSNYEFSKEITEDFYYDDEKEKIMIRFTPSYYKVFYKP